MDKRVNEKKKRTAIVITFLVLMICITGGTYAYFALTASNNSVTGSVGGASLNLEVTKVYPTSEHNNKNMIPQLESTLDEAISLDHKCVDGNGNVICQVYKATVTNVGSTSSVLNGTISFELPEREAGLYDNNWNMLASWDELVDDYGLDITYTDYSFCNETPERTLSCIVKNNSNLSSVSKIIIDNNVTTIGEYQFFGLSNVNEIALPDNVSISALDSETGELGDLSHSGLIIYYSGNAVNAPWGAVNATVVPRESLSSAIPNLKWMRINDSNTLGTYSSYQATTEKALFEEERSFGVNTSNTYYFVFWIDETGEVQTDNGEFRANIEFDSSTGGLTSTVRPLLTKHISSLYNDGSAINTVNIADDANKQQVSLNATQKLMYVDQGTTYGEEYRYYSASPNNYVSFNGELWRIISSSKVFSSEEDTTGEQRVRIIRDNNIKYHAWDYNSNNNWVTSTLMTTLNNPYYNSTNGTCYMNALNNIYPSLLECDYKNGDIKGLNVESKNLISDALWYLGGSSDQNLYADDWYNVERNNSGYGSNPIRYTDAVGIMYLSDYLYAADLNVCKNPGVYINYETLEYKNYGDPLCSGTDWLYNSKVSYEWLMAPSSGSSNYAWSISTGGYIEYALDPINSSYAVRPVVVLKSNVIVTNGNGTSGNPYNLGLGA